MWSKSVENEINQMKINDPKYWVAMDNYIRYFEDWIDRPEYTKWIVRALKNEGPGY